MERGTGITTKQMQAAPQGAVFVWCNRHTHYPKALALKLGRDDLDIRPLAWLRPENVRGREFAGVVVDHAAQLDSDGYEALSWVHQSRMRSNVQLEREKVKSFEDAAVTYQRQWFEVSEQLAAEIKMRNVWQCAYEESREDLAAAQATIAEMREADLKIVGRNLTEEMALAAARLFDEANGRKITAERLWQVLFDAAPPLAIPANNDALHEAMDKEREECAAICDRFYERGMNPAECAGAIRARKEGKL